MGLKSFGARGIFRWAVVWVLSGCMLPLNLAAKPETLQTAADQVVIGGVAVAAVIGGLTIWAIYHHESQFVRGCVVSGPGGLELRVAGEEKTYELTGATAAVKAGENVRLHGKHRKTPKGSTGNPTFMVTNVAKDYGACAR